MSATQTTAGLAAKVSGYRQQIAADPNLYGTVDLVMWLVEDTPDRTWTPSEVAKVLRIDTSTAYEMLRELYCDGYIAADQRGAWTRYSARRA